MREAFRFSQHELLRLADFFLATAVGSTAGEGTEACLSLAECESVVAQILPALPLQTASAEGATLLQRLCVALSRAEGSHVTLANFAHGLHAIHGGAATRPQRTELCFRMLDFDGDGEIGAHDFTLAVQLVPSLRVLVVGRETRRISAADFAAMVGPGALIDNLSWSGSLCVGIRL